VLPHLSRGARREIIGVKEEDPRHNAPDFALEKERALTKGRMIDGHSVDGVPVNANAEENVKLLDSVCFIPKREQHHEIAGMLDEICREGLFENAGCMRTSSSV